MSIGLLAPTDRRDEILAVLRSLTEPALADPACLYCRVFQDSDDPDTITFAQTWATEPDLRRHFARHQCRKLLAVVDLAAEEPTIRLDGLEMRLSGIEALVELQAESGARANPPRER